MNLSAIEMQHEFEPSILGDQQMLSGTSKMRGPSTTQQPSLSSHKNSVIAKYKHKGHNSLYYLKPGSQSIFLLDFKRQSFIEEKIDSQTFLPPCFTSVQTEDGNIYMVGGLIKNKDLALKFIFKLDNYLNYEECGSMKTGRFCAPLALLKNNYIVIVGGQVSIKSSKYTNLCEVYDIQKK